MTIETTPLRVTKTQRANLEKLAAWLFAHADTINFAMETFNNDFDEPIDVYKTKHTCGTIGCAVGHGPLAGIKPQRAEEWHEYARRCFGAEMNDDDDDSYVLWEWLFDGDWHRSDNTARGAGQRILWALQNGVPSRSESINMQNGDRPLIYTTEGPATLTS